MGVHTMPADTDPRLTAGDAGAPVRRRWKRALKRVGVTLGALLPTLLVLGVVLYEFGTMEAPAPEMRAAYVRLETAGKAPPAPSPGFHIPIPGCRCHSTDPVQTMAHTRYKIRDCGRCHGSGAQAAAR